MLLILFLNIAYAAKVHHNGPRHAHGWMDGHRMVQNHPRGSPSSSLSNVAMPSSSAVSSSIASASFVLPSTSTKPQVTTTALTSLQSVQSTSVSDSHGAVQNPVSDYEHRPMPEGSVVSWLTCRAGEMCCYDVSYWPDATSDFRRNTLSRHTDRETCRKKINSYTATDCGFWSKGSTNLTTLRVGHLTGPKDNVLHNEPENLCHVEPPHLAKIDLDVMVSRRKLEQEYLRVRCTDLCGPEWKTARMDFRLPDGRDLSAEYIWTSLNMSLYIGNYDKC